MDFKNKYLKYKNKYLTIINKLNMKGGAKIGDTVVGPDGEIRGEIIKETDRQWELSNKETSEKTDEGTKWFVSKIGKTLYNIDGEIIGIIKNDYKFDKVLASPNYRLNTGLIISEEQIGKTYTFEPVLPNLLNKCVIGVNYDYNLGNSYNESFNKLVPISIYKELNEIGVPHILLTESGEPDYVNTLFIRHHPEFVSRVEKMLESGIPSLRKLGIQEIPGYVQKTPLYRIIQSKYSLEPDYFDDEYNQDPKWIGEDGDGPRYRGVRVIETIETPTSLKWNDINNINDTPVFFSCLDKLTGSERHRLKLYTRQEKDEIYQNLAAAKYEYTQARKELDDFHLHNRELQGMDAASVAQERVIQTKVDETETMQADMEDRWKMVKGTDQDRGEGGAGYYTYNEW